MGSPEYSRNGKSRQKNPVCNFPIHASNTHFGRLPALGVAALEMKLFGAQFAARSLERTDSWTIPHENGVKVLAEKKGFHAVHQIALDVKGFRRRQQSCTGA